MTEVDLRQRSYPPSFSFIARPIIWKRSQPQGERVREQHLYCDSVKRFSLEQFIECDTAPRGGFRRAEN